MEAPWGIRHSEGGPAGEPPPQMGTPHCIAWGNARPPGARPALNARSGGASASAAT